MLNDFKEFAMRGNVLDMAVGIIIGGRHHHAADWPWTWSRGFFQFVYQSRRDSLCDHCRSEDPRGGDAELWLIPEYHRDFLDRGLRDFFAAARGQSLARQPGSSRCSNNARLPAMRHANTVGSEKMRTL